MPATNKYPSPKIVHNGLVRIVERWTDPGDYPSNAGGGPMAPHDYISGISGRIVLRYDNAAILWHEAETGEPIALYGWDKVVCYDIDNMGILNQIPTKRTIGTRDSLPFIKLTPTQVGVLQVNYDLDGAEVVAEIEDVEACN